MSLGRRCGERQQTLWVDAKKLGGGPRNAFYDRLNQVLAKIEFDRQLKSAAEPYYQKTGRKGLPAGWHWQGIRVPLAVPVSSPRKLLVRQVELPSRRNERRADIEPTGVK